MRMRLLICLIFLQFITFGFSADLDVGVNVTLATTVGDIGDNTTNPTSTEAAVENGNNVAEDDEDPKYMENHMHPHPPMKKYATAKTIMRFTYGDKDAFGPEKWDSVPSALLTTNECPMNKFTPLNISSLTAGLAEADQSPGQGSTIDEEGSLTLFVSNDINSAGWEFGFPEDTFNGIAIIPKVSGMLQLLDEYDSHEKAEGMPSRLFDFTFALVTFCDFSKHSSNRSGHQIDGRRLPFEVHLLFFGFSMEIGIDKTMFGDKRNDIVMVSILGEISKDDNLKLKPMIAAAKRFRGDDYAADNGYGPVPIRGSFSPMAFFPKDSGYFYYKGSFPIPPCFSIPRIYVLKEPIPISENQLSVLTKIKSKREPSGVLSCTFPILQESVTENQILHNPTKIRFSGYNEEGTNRAANNLQLYFIQLLILHLLKLLS